MQPALAAGQRQGRRGRLATDCDQAQHTSAQQIAGEVFHHRDRVRVSPVQVLQDDDHAAGIRDAAEQLDQCLAPDRRRNLSPVIRPANARDDRAERRQPGHQAAVTGHRMTPKRLQQCLGQRPAGHADPGWHPTAGYHRRARTCGLDCHLMDQAGLANARLARQEHAPAPPAQRVSEIRGEHPELLLPADHDRTQHVTHNARLPPHCPGRPRSSQSRPVRHPRWQPSQLPGSHAHPPPRHTQDVPTGDLTSGHHAPKGLSACQRDRMSGQPPAAHSRQELGGPAFRSRSATAAGRTLSGHAVTSVVPWEP